MRLEIMISFFVSQSLFVFSDVRLPFCTRSLFTGGICRKAANSRY